MMFWRLGEKGWGNQWMSNVLVEQHRLHQVCQISHQVIYFIGRDGVGLSQFLCELVHPPQQQDSPEEYLNCSKISLAWTGCCHHLRPSSPRTREDSMRTRQNKDDRKPWNRWKLWGTCGEDWRRPPRNEPCWTPSPGKRRPGHSPLGTPDKTIITLNV